MSDERDNPLWQIVEEARNEWRLSQFSGIPSNGSMNDYIVRAILAAGWRPPLPESVRQQVEAIARGAEDPERRPAWEMLAEAAGWRRSPAPAAQPADAAAVTDAQQILSGEEFNGMAYVAKAQKVARWGLAEHARAEAAEQSYDKVLTSWAESRERHLAAEAALAAARAEIERLREALDDISKSGPVDQHGEPDPYAGWSWCYERARAALEATDGR